MVILSRCFDFDSFISWADKNKIGACERVDQGKNKHNFESHNHIS